MPHQPTFSNILALLVLTLAFLNTFINGLDHDLLSSKLNFEQKVFTSTSTPCRVQVDNNGRHGCYSPRGGVAAAPLEANGGSILFPGLLGGERGGSYNSVA